MIKKILIANRGEIAIRIIRACRDMGIVSVAVYSTADKDALHTYIADESVCIGEARSKDSYLNMQAIISAAIITGADAIHPGYGFLSENTQFVRLCAENNIVFIGPSVESMNLVGDKASAKALMKSCGVPVIPGSEGCVDDIEQAKKLAQEIGYPLMIKASAGGGGRGIRIVSEPSEFEKLYDVCRAEAIACFGDGSIYLEKYIEKPRHIEVQIIADSFGNTCHLYERDCSLQRRHQKVLEESPSPVLDEGLRKAMGESAVKAARAAKYENAGTIEFLVDKDLNYYFMEMNTRIQVEHPVTEYVTGVDLVRAQIEIASGMPLPFGQCDITQTGHAIECRINAENPAKNFAPSPGTIVELNVPGGLGVRVDSAVYQGYKIPPYYDSMIAKLIVHGANRAEAIARMRRALAEYVFDGVETNTEYLMQILSNEDFINVNYDNTFLNTFVMALE